MDARMGGGSRSKRVDAAAQGQTPHATFTWVVRDFSRQQDRVTSEEFDAGGCSWRLLCFPRGNGSATCGALALYLLATDAEGWASRRARAATFKLTLLNHGDPSHSIRKDASHNFCREEPDWGFTLFVPRYAALDPDAGFIRGDTLTFRVDLAVAPPDSSWAPISEEMEAEAHRLVRVATDIDLQTQIGSSVFLDLLDFDKVRIKFKLPKGASLAEVRRLIAEQLGVLPGQHRLWRWAQRQNGTYRPIAPLEKEDIPLVFRGHPGAVLCIDLYIEAPAQPERPLLPRSPLGEILLFVKLYSPGGAAGPPPRLQYAGNLRAHLATTVQELLPALAHLAGLPRGCAVEAWEEISHEPRLQLDPLRPQKSLAACQLKDGDILMVQQRLPPEEACQLAYPTARDFLAKQLSQQQVGSKQGAGGGHRQQADANSRAWPAEGSASQPLASTGALVVALQEAAQLRQELQVKDEALKAKEVEIKTGQEEVQSLRGELQQIKGRMLLVEGDEEACRGRTADELDQAVAELEGWVARLRRRATQRRVEEAQADAAACMVCFTARKDTFLGCGHLVCEACGAQLSACPACRTPVTCKMRAFL